MPQLHPFLRLAASLALFAGVVGGCERGDVGATYALDDAPELIALSPATPGLRWPAEPTATESHGAEALPDDPDVLLQELKQATESIPVLGGASREWQDDAKIANVVADVFETDAGAHDALAPGRRFAVGWGQRLGRVVRNEEIDDLGEEAWGLEVDANGTQVTYGWRRENAILQLHVHCASGCPESVWDAARAWADAIDDRARTLARTT
jgi:hypothetical protein